MVTAHPAPQRKREPRQGEDAGAQSGQPWMGGLIRPPYSPKQQAIDESSSL